MTAAKKKFDLTHLTPEQHHVTQREGTERAFSGDYWDTKTPGIYACVVCGTPLFDSKHKFDSGTGWPSFWQAVQEDAVGIKEDRKFFMRRNLRKTPRRSFISTPSPSRLRERPSG